jgi:hypothetical protein
VLAQVSGVGVGEGTGSACGTVKRTKLYVFPAARVIAVDDPLSKKSDEPCRVAGPRIVVQPALGFVGSYSATYESEASVAVTPDGGVNVKLGAVAKLTVAFEVMVTNASGVIALAPMFAGRRCTLCSCGVPLGALAENVVVSVALVLAAGIVALPVKPPVIGPNVPFALPVGDTAIEALVVGGGVGFTGGVECPPPPHDVISAERARQANNRATTVRLTADPHMNGREHAAGKPGDTPCSFHSESDRAALCVQRESNRATDGIGSPVVSLSLPIISRRRRPCRY